MRMQFFTKAAVARDTVLEWIRSFDNSDNSDSSLQELLRVPRVVQEFGGPFERHNTGTLGFHYALSCELGNLFQHTGDVSTLLINLDGR